MRLFLVKKKTIAPEIIKSRRICLLLYLRHSYQTSLVLCWHTVEWFTLVNWSPLGGLFDIPLSTDLRIILSTFEAPVFCLNAPCLRLGQKNTIQKLRHCVTDVDTFCFVCFFGIMRRRLLKCRYIPPPIGQLDRGISSLPPLSSHLKHPS
jgi:hypothetical protein